ncbi:MAG: hypothetical protein KAV87_11370, partial [Desulfobacteraceae bacterium]|nr:hypothetical protein [Desulfobacteraceae bacterium]
EAEMRKCEVIFERALRLIGAIGLAIVLSSAVWAMNSLVSPGDIERMRKAKISDAVIQTLIAEQTCSVTAAFLITLKRFGADDKMLEGVILADRYKDPAKADLSAKQIELLKKAGYSEEMILKLFHTTPVKRVVDEQGNECVVYGTGVSSKPEATTPSQSQGTFNIYIEKMERP